MFQFILFFLIFFVGIYYTNKSVLNSYCFLLLSYFILSYNIGFQIKLLGINYVLSFSRVYFAAFLLVYLFKRFYSKNKNIYLVSSSDRLLLLLLFYIILTMFFGVSLSSDLKSFLSEKWLLGFGAFFIAKDVFRTKDSIVTLLKYLFLSTIIIAIYGIIEFVTRTPLMQLPFFRSMVLIDTLDKSPIFEPNIGFVTRGSMLRLSGTFWNSIIFSIALTFLYPFYLSMKTFNIKYLKLGFIPITLVAILTIGRTAWFSMILALFFNMKRNKLLTIIAIFCFTFIAIPYFNQNIENKNFLDQNIFSINSRTYTLPILLLIPFKTLLVGNGLGSYIYALENEELTIFTRLCGDNSILQIIYTLGIIGAVMIIIFFGRYYSYLRKTRKNFEKDSFEFNLIKSTQVVIIIQMTLFIITNSIFQDTRLFFIFFSLLGAISGYLNSTINEIKLKLESENNITNNK